MKLRGLKRRHDIKTTRQARIWAPDHFDVVYSDRDGEDHFFHDDDGEIHDVTCKHCDGTGRDEWNDGILPCQHCDGEGYAWWR